MGVCASLGNQQRVSQNCNAYQLDKFQIQTIVEHVD